MRESVIFGELAFADKRYSCMPSDLLDEGVIGEGAFGTVCKMLHAESGTRMAVKVGILWNMETAMLYFEFFLFAGSGYILRWRKRTRRR
jgi:hypothetical protein